MSYCRGCQNQFNLIEKKMLKINTKRENLWEFSYVYKRKFSEKVQNTGCVLLFFRVRM